MGTGRSRVIAESRWQTLAKTVGYDKETGVDKETGFLPAISRHPREIWLRNPVSGQPPASH
ncbi:MAG: hypothetical protein Fur0025_00320 [Oscillatoriaceae cyanobacterium]